MIGAGGREWRLVKLRRDIMSRETGTFFLPRRVRKKSNNKDNTVKSSVEFEKLSPQSGIVR